MKEEGFLKRRRPSYSFTLSLIFFQNYNYHLFQTKLFRFSDITNWIRWNQLKLLKILMGFLKPCMMRIFSEEKPKFCKKIFLKDIFDFQYFGCLKFLPIESNFFISKRISKKLEFCAYWKFAFVAENFCSKCR